MNSRSNLILDAALQMLRPLVRLMLRHGVAYPAFAAALKQVFLAEADQELKRRGMARTDSAVSLLSGVHRRDVRNLTRLAPAAAHRPQGFSGIAAEVVGRWLSDARWLGPQEQPRALPRSGNEDGFAALVRAVSSDVRPRAVLDELLRLGIVTETGDHVHLLTESFTPRQGFEEMALHFQANLHDHLAAAAQNLEGESNFLEQSVYVDQISPESVVQIQKAAQLAWRQAFKTVMRVSQSRFDHDAANTPPQARSQRARFGLYFYSAEDKNEIPPA